MKTKPQSSVRTKLQQILNHDLKVKVKPEIKAARYDKFIFSSKGSVPHRAFMSKKREVVLAGPADTGKSAISVMFSHWLASNFPNTRILWIRKTRESIKNSLVPTFNEFLPYDPLERGHEVFLKGGSNPTGYEYSNGSVIHFGGTNHPEGYLSTQWHHIMINQAEELTEEQVALLRSRCTFRAAHPSLNFRQIRLDCNPSDANHWLPARKERFQNDPEQKDNYEWFEILHKHNRSIMDEDGNYLSEEARQRVEDLKALPHLLYERLYLGKWTSAAGVVYPMFDPKIHVKPMTKDNIPPDWNWASAMDHGFEDPRVFWIFAYSPDRTKIRFMYEIYMTKLNTNEVIPEIRKMAERLGIDPFPVVCDHDSDENDILVKAGIPIVRAHKQPKKDKKTGALFGGLKAGIDNMKDWLNRGDDSILFNEYSITGYGPEAGLWNGEIDNRLVVRHHPTSTVGEFGVYSYWPEEEQKKKPDPDKPRDGFDHGMDTTRYGLWWVANYRPFIRI